MNKPSGRTLRIAALSACAAPLLMLGFTGSASAAELTPVAEYLDTTIADLLSDIGGALDSLGLAAAE